MSNDTFNPAPTTQPAKPKKGKKWLWIVGGIIAFFVIVGAATGGNKSAPTTAPTPATTAAAQVVQPEAPASTPPPVSTETASQKNAVRAAKNYISMMPFSHDGLIKQLAFDKYTAEDAAYAVDSLKADWNAQAAKKAKSYLDMTAFSHDGLVKQLAFDGFTPEQAEFGTTQAGI